MKRVCVFCGSSVGARPEYADAARAVAAELVRRGLGLVYGGGSIGLMGVVADAVLAGGGEVIGVIPSALATREFAHTGLTELRVVESMHERKATMAGLADSFISLPGGLGTFEETLEILTWAQLGIHRKPIGLLQIRDYWAPLLALLTHAVEEGFVARANLALVTAGDTPAELLDRFVHWRPPPLPRVWLGLRET